VNHGLDNRADASLETRRAREQRLDCEITLPFNERVEVACPECGEEFPVTIATSTPAASSPSWGRCTNWECDAFLKFRHEDAVESSKPSQTGLEQFAGGDGQ
jgi:predicted RNA-binding Zn-ribbon protein involved in translation (DUF1610 family)